MFILSRSAFQDTDTLLVNFIDKEIVETRDINEDTLIELDSKGNLVSMTIEHAKKQANMEDFSYHQVVKGTVDERINATSQ